MPTLTTSQMQTIMPRSAPAASSALVFNATMVEFVVALSSLRMAEFLAPIAHESDELRRLDENLNCAPAGKRSPMCKATREDRKSSTGLARRLRWESYEL